MYHGHLTTCSTVCFILLCPHFDTLFCLLFCYLRLIYSCVFIGCADIERRTSATRRFRVKVCYFAVLNDTIYDLLRNCTTNVKLMDTENGVVVSGANEMLLTSPREIFEVLRMYVAPVLFRYVYAMFRCLYSFVLFLSVVLRLVCHCSGKQSLRIASSSRPELRTHGHTVLQVICENTQLPSDEGKYLFTF